MTEETKKMYERHEEFENVKEAPWNQPKQECCCAQNFWKTHEIEEMVTSFHAIEIPVEFADDLNFWKNMQPAANREKLAIDIVSIFGKFYMVSTCLQTQELCELLTAFETFIDKAFTD